MSCGSPFEGQITFHVILGMFHAETSLFSFPWCMITTVSSPAKKYKSRGKMKKILALLLSLILGFIGKGLTEDISLLDGSGFDALIDYLKNEFPPALEELSERVSVPYEAG